MSIDWAGSIINITSPTTSVDGQVLHDFIEDQMATPVGVQYADIIQPEGKIEDPSNPGVFSQIIIILNSPWQIQFWGGSGYTRIFGAKIVGGLSDQPLKATGTAGDITVLESPVDGLTVTSGSGLSAAQDAKLTAINDQILGYSQIDYTGNDFLGWQRVHYDASDVEIARYNLFDEDGARITGTAQAFAAASKMIGSEDKL